MGRNWWLEDDEEDKKANPGEYSNVEYYTTGEGHDDDDHTPGRLSFWRRLKTWQVVLFSTLAVFIVGGVWLWIAIAAGLPTLDQLENPHPELATRLISADGEPLDQYYVKNRTTIHLKEVPKELLQALIATEDRDFYDHWGLNLWRNISAAWTDVVTLSPKQGASTITQQLARNLYLSQEKSMIRKFREMASAVQIERTHTKNEILEMYLNVAYFGRGAYGIQVASQVYFGKDVNELSPTEAAYLVGILKGPENYDPEENYDRAIARRNTVIDNLKDGKYITEVRAEKMKAEPIKVLPMKGYQGIAPHFAEMIRQDLSKKPELQGYDLYRDGLVVYTTLNATLQRAANRAVDEHIGEYQKTIVDKRWNWNAHKGLLDTIVLKAIRGNAEYRNTRGTDEKRAVEKKLRTSQPFIDSVKKSEIRLQCGFVALDQSTGQILAMVGSSNFREARYGLNHVTQIVRQPGSAFKPIIYSAAFEAGSTPESIVSNEPISMPDGDRVWAPGNFEGESVGGSMSIRSALQWSVNLCAIHAMLDLTSTQDVVRMAKRLGIRSNVPAYPSIALGTAEVSPMELTSAYSTFANEGIRATPVSILRVEDRNGKVLYKTKPEFENVMEPRIAHMITSCLMDVVDRGTAARIRAANNFRFPAAGKTGTTQSYGDAWFIGYTPHFTAGVWVGFDDKRVTFTGADGQGGRAAAPVWGKFMKYAYDALKPKVSYFVTSYSNNATPGEMRVHTEDSGTVRQQIPTIPNKQPDAPDKYMPVPTPKAPQPVTPGPIGEGPVAPPSGGNPSPVGESQAAPTHNGQASNEVPPGVDNRNPRGAYSDPGAYTPGNPTKPDAAVRTNSDDQSVPGAINPGPPATVADAEQSGKKPKKAKKQQQAAPVDQEDQATQKKEP